MSAGNDWADAKHMGAAAACGIVEGLAALGVDARNVEVVDLAPERENAPVGWFRVRVSDDDPNQPGAVYTVIVT